MNLRWDQAVSFTGDAPPGDADLYPQRNGRATFDTPGARRDKSAKCSQLVDLHEEVARLVTTGEPGWQLVSHQGARRRDFSREAAD